MKTQLQVLSILALGTALFFTGCASDEPAVTTHTSSETTSLHSAPVAPVSSSTETQTVRRY